MSSERAQQSMFKPTLSLFDATAISVGAIIGAGIFVVTGIVAGYAGSALIISMLIAAIVALFTALSFAELTAWMPKEGSIYEYAHELISPFTGFLAGWMWVVSNTFTGAAVSLGFAYYLTASAPFLEPKWIAVLLCLFFTILNYLGIRQSALINNVLVAAKLGILAFFCIFGLLNVNPSNFMPFNPFQAGILYGASYIFFAYGGFARVAVIAEEVKDAERNVPKAMLLSLLLSTIFYLAVGAVAVGLIGANALANSNSPLKDAISASKSPFAEYLVSVGGLVATASVLLTSIMGVSRMTYAMARRKDLPQTLSKLHIKYNTPHYAVWIVGAIIILLILSIDLTKVIAISTFALLFYYAIANISALKLKTTKRKYPKILPVIGALTCLLTLVFILFVSPHAWVMGTASLLIGATYYGITKGRA
ncbi:MAG: APC family permease [Candidatus Bathyarchaeia archaeon]